MLLLRRSTTFSHRTIVSPPLQGDVRLYNPTIDSAPFHHFISRRRRLANRIHMIVVVCSAGGSRLVYCSIRGTPSTDTRNPPAFEQQHLARQHGTQNTSPVWTHNVQNVARRVGRGAGGVAACVKRLGWIRHLHYGAYVVRLQQSEKQQYSTAVVNSTIGSIHHVSRYRCSTSTEGPRTHH